MSNDIKEGIAIFTMVVLGCAATIGAICFIFWFLVIAIPSMRHETPEQQAFNRCVQNSGYNTNAPAACAVILKGSK